MAEALANESIHAATHLAAKLERRERDDRDGEPAAGAADGLARLDEEADQDGDA